MSIEENKAVVVCHLKDVLEQGRVELLENYYAPDGNDPNMATLEQHRDRILWFQETCPGFKVTILDMVAEGDQVMVNVEFNLTYSVPPKIPPTEFPPLGKPVTWKNMNLFRVVEGKMVSNQTLSGWTDMLVEIGINPLPSEAQNKAAVVKFIDACNRQDTALLAEVCSPELAKEWTEALPGIYASMKGHHIELVDLVADNRGVAVKMATSGYHTGILHGLPPTGNWWTNRVFAFIRIEGGKIVEVDLLPDAENIIKQIGGSIQPIKD